MASATKMAQPNDVSRGTEFINWYPMRPDRPFDIIACCRCRTSSRLALDPPPDRLPSHNIRLDLRGYVFRTGAGRGFQTGS
jgi:hypothetical protein